MNNIIERNKRVEDNMGLVYMVAKKFTGRGVDFEDIVQIGSVGLLKASERYNPELDVKFSTYAVAIIIGEIKRFIRDDGLVKIPRTVKETGLKILKAIEQLKRIDNREPTLEELSKYTKISIEKIVEALDAMQPYESLYAETDNNVMLCERIADDNEASVNIEDSIFLKEIIKYLDSRLRQIVILRFFKDNTQSEVAKCLNISQVQVSRLEKKALEILKNMSKTTM